VDSVAGEAADRVGKEVGRLNKAYGLLRTGVHAPERRRTAASVIRASIDSLTLVVAQLEQGSAGQEPLPSCAPVQLRSEPDAAAPVVFTRLLVNPNYPCRLPHPLVVHNPRDGVRPVSADGRTLGSARSVDDVVGLLGGTGVADHCPQDPDPGVLIEWRGGSPTVWPCSSSSAAC